MPVWLSHASSGEIDQRAGHRVGGGEIICVRHLVGPAWKRLEWDSGEALAEVHSFWSRCLHRGKGACKYEASYSTKYNKFCCGSTLLHNGLIEMMFDSQNLTVEGACPITQPAHTRSRARPPRICTCPIWAILATAMRQARMNSPGFHQI